MGYASLSLPTLMTLRGVDRCDGGEATKSRSGTRISPLRMAAAPAAAAQHAHALSLDTLLIHADDHFEKVRC